MMTASSPMTEITGTVRATLLTSLDYSTSNSADADVSETPTETVAATTTGSSVDSANSCSDEEVAHLTKLNENNLHLQSQCNTRAGLDSYVFPFSGGLSYDQMVAMSMIIECEYYFRAVLLVQLKECVNANVYIRTTAETVLQLAVTSENAPTEAEVNEAMAVRKTYNSALRDGDDAASYSAMSGASALSWNIEGNTIDTIDPANTTGQLLLSTELYVIGTYYAPPNISASAISTIQDVRIPGHSTDISVASEKRNLSWLVALISACTSVLLH
ncbi:unnamed protein product [Peronospora belbahrii]|uniref:Uncharacterized protein n=1 Tax=Peronospora belbahrii TaxID=622444 RepID=A0ABN8CPL3_9STRA|nr:unnamed protein product [Peronospora belbahrii]